MPLIFEKFIKFLEGEIQEKVLCQGLEMFGLWSIKFKGELDADTVKWFTKGMEAKAQTIRISYLQWLLRCLTHATLPSSVNLTEHLIKIVEKAAQNVTQTPAVCEGLAAACIVLSLTSEKQSCFQSFWNIVLDMNKEIFISEKFIGGVGSESLSNALFMSEKLLTNFLDQLKGDPQRLFQILLIASTSKIEKVQSIGIATIKRLTQTPNAASLMTNLLLELRNFIENSQITSGNDEENDDYLTAKALVEVILAIHHSAPIEDQKHKQLLIQHSLLVCHHKKVKEFNPRLWEEILYKHNIDNEIFISTCWPIVKQEILDNFKCNSMYENSVACLSGTCPEVVHPVIIENVTKVLNDTTIIQVTDEEYFTFLTPEGELYNKSVLPNQEEQPPSQIRRENKAYSYKEQLEELQLKREIEEKKRKEGKTKPPQLTPKQKEAIKNQIEKENAIRLKCSILNEKLSGVISLIECAVKGNTTHFSLFFSKLLPAILRCLKSPLAASPLTKLYYSLRKAVFEEDQCDLGEKIAISTIMLHEPKCDLPEDWTKIDLTVMVPESVLSLKTLILEEENVAVKAFSYVFQFLKQAFVSNYISDDMVLIGIKIISKHAQLKGNSTDEEDLSDHAHPKYLPVLDIMRLLVHTIKSYRGQIQIQAIDAFLALVNNALSGQSYQSTSKDEIEFIINLLINDLEIIRETAVRALTKIIKALPTTQDEQHLGSLVVRRIFVAKHDVSSDVQQLAEELWEIGGFEIPKVLIHELMNDIMHHEICIQKAAASALATILNDDSTTAQAILNQLLELYVEKLTIIPPVLDQFNNREIVPAIDPWQTRRGVAIAISKLGQFFDTATVENVIQFMVSTGLLDRAEVVHKEMLAASLAIVDIRGKDCVDTLLPVFEEFLDNAPNDSDFDNIRQAVVILMGSLARHLNKDDKRINPIVQRLLISLATPSQQVQEAVANCIPHLIPSLKDQSPQIVKKLMNQLVKSDKYGERRGAAYGIAGVVKGLGILSLKQLEIMSKLTNHIQDKKNYKCREGALFAFEMLCSTLGRLFEPYIVHVLPHLLQCFGDSSQYVRQAAEDTSKVVMGKLSAHGVKLVLPSLLAALEEESWRTKIASVELLAQMSNCAPKQLSSCLPSIVPKLIDIVLGDSHIKVQESGTNALKMIGSVIKNPEIQAIVPVLLKALEDPSNKTSPCLQSLLETKFVHFIDAPSLALIMPVVQRAFMDRSTETRKMAAQIIGNMYSLTDQKDLTPYLDNILPGLKASLLDPVPEVRTTT